MGRTGAPVSKFPAPHFESSIRRGAAPRRSPCASRHAGPAPPGDTLTLKTWRARNRHALREFWPRARADALGVKQELEKALTQDGKPAK
jgi:hypothetical protein